MNEIPLITIKESKEAGRKLPEIMFIEDVPKFVKKYGKEAVIENLNHAYNKFKFTESQFQNYKTTVAKKVPEINRSLELIKAMLKKKDEENQIKFQLSDGLFVEGTVPKGNKTVALWLGSDVMVEYSLEEGIELLQNNLDKAEYSIKTYNEDLEFLKEQITCCEVNMSRVHNHIISLDEQAKHAEMVNQANQKLK
jgi:prefoldin subunit 5